MQTKFYLIHVTTNIHEIEQFARLTYIYMQQKCLAIVKGTLDVANLSQTYWPYDYQTEINNCTIRFQNNSFMT